MNQENKYIREVISIEELALQRNKYSHLSDEQFRFMLQQIEGRQRTQEKLPSFAKIDDWWYPPRLACEQCSSEITARYKATHIISQLLHSKYTLVDLTGGYGVDTYFMSENAQEVHYVERNDELCRIATHNFLKSRPQISIHNTDSVSFLHSMHPCDVIYIDPARRDTHGGKVFKLEDCEPDITKILDLLFAKSKLLIIKLSPMLDISAALKSINIPCTINILAVRNEVKEILICIQHNQEQVNQIRAINLNSNETLDNKQEIKFTQEEEKEAICKVYDKQNSELLKEGTYIYEPNAAIIKAGAYKLVAIRYDLCKMGTNTHLYFSDKLVIDFPGRVWKLISTDIKKQKDIRANIMTRNYPLSPDQLRKKLKIKDDDTHTIIGARLGDKPTLLLAKRINQHTTSS